MYSRLYLLFFFFFFHDTASPEIYTLSYTTLFRSVRVAVGARRLRLIRQMLTESLLMASLGGAAGLVLSIWGIRLLRAGFSFNFFVEQLGQHIHLDQRTLLFTLAASLLTAILFGLVPALRASNVQPGD